MASVPLPDLPPHIYLLKKPSGISSRRAAEQLARLQGKQKAGHAGTLDVLAEGLLIVGVGEGTKALRHFVGLPKTYEAVVCLGRSTTTDDREGAVEEEADARYLTYEQVAEVVRAMVGPLSLPVPRWSAVRVGGKRLYHLARQGKDSLTPPLRQMEVHEATLVAFDPTPHPDAPHLRHAHIVWHVASGTYIRSLARELGRRLGVPASLCWLQRTAIGPYNIKDPRVVTISTF